jgi:hypothetical protein
MDDSSIQLKSLRLLLSLARLPKSLVSVTSPAGGPRRSNLPKSRFKGNTTETGERPPRPSSEVDLLDPRSTRGKPIRHLRSCTLRRVSLGGRWPRQIFASNLCSDRDPNPLAGSCTSTRRPQLHRASSRCRIASQSLAPSLCSRDR